MNTAARAATTCFGVRGLVRAFRRRLVAVEGKGVPFAGDGGMKGRSENRFFCGLAFLRLIGEILSQWHVSSTRQHFSGPHDESPPVNSTIHEFSF